MKKKVQCVCVFSKIFHYLQPLPHKHWAAIGYTEIGQIGQPIGVIVHSHCVKSFENLLQRYVGEGLNAVDNEKKNIFS